VAIATARGRVGLSQGHLADALGIRPSSVSQWEHEATTPTLAMFRKVVAVLGPWPLLRVLLPSDLPDGAAVEADPQASRPDRHPAADPGRAGPVVKDASGTGPIPGLGAAIATARRQARLSQTGLADTLGIAQPSVGQWEREATTPTLAMFRKVVAVLGPWPLLGVLLRPDAPDKPAVGGDVDRQVRRPDRQDLARLIDQGRSDTAIGHRYGVGATTVSQWRQTGGLEPPAPRRGRPSALPTRHELAGLVDQGLSDEEIGRRYGRAASTVMAWRSGYGLLRANPSERPSPQMVARLVAEGLSDKEIGRRYGVADPTVATWRRAAGVRRERRPGVDAQRALKLRQQGLPAADIAEELGCSVWTVYKVSQPARGATTGGRAERLSSSSRQPSGRRPAKEELAGLIKQGLPDREIGERYGVPDWTVVGWRRKYKLVRKPPLEPPSKEELTELVEQGLSDQKIGERYGKSGRWVASLRRSYDLRQPPPMTPPSKEELAELVGQGLSDHKIGERYGRSGSWVASLRGSYDLPQPPRVRVDPAEVLELSGQGLASIFHEDLSLCEVETGLARSAAIRTLDETHCPDRLAGLCTIGRPDRRHQAAGGHTPGPVGAVAAGQQPPDMQAGGCRQGRPGQPGGGSRLNAATSAFAQGQSRSKRNRCRRAWRTSLAAACHSR
jgi:transcriptional regulator with XRE-family HTH domain/DNA-binding NarL/FixJ family response regulator